MSIVRINMWSGVVSSASPYILPAGGAVQQINCMSLIPGQLTVRSGMKAASGFTIVGPTTGDEIWGYTTGSYGTPYVFISTDPAVFSQGRRGEVYRYDGNSEGQVWSPSLKAWRAVGLAGPGSAPTISVNTTPTFYVARVDIDKNGTGYTRPPRIVIQAPTNASSSNKTATAVARVTKGSLSSITVTETGKNYTTTPSVRVVDTDATGKDLATAVELEPGFATGDPTTGIVYWEIIQNGKSYPCIPAAISSGVGRAWAATKAATGGSGTGAVVRVSYTRFTAANICTGDDPIVNKYFVEVEAMGSGYTATGFVDVEIPFATQWNNATGPGNCGDGCAMIIRGYTLGHPSCPAASRLAELNPHKARKIKVVTVTNPGLFYLQAPSCTFLPFTGAPASLGDIAESTTNASGEVATVVPPDTRLYLFHPVLSGTDAGNARALAVVRATLRGKYQCYYRFVNDSVPEAEGGPLYSNLSPVLEIDAGDGASQLSWSAGGGGGSSVELWRSSSDQATTLFRVAKFGGTGSFGSATDTLTDWELTDPDREGFLAMPILLPNGELNANRFGVPPADYAVGVMFQDRMWMGVSPGGAQCNTLRFSEADEPESMPDVNELIIQSNLRSTDYITALIPYAGAMIVCQSRHSHRLTYVSQPLIDAAFFLLAYRGCCNQRCWDIYDGRVYAMDDQGVYSLDPQGNVESLTLGIDDIWRGKLDMTLASRFIVRADRKLNVLRISVAFQHDGSVKYPTRQLVYSFDYKTWWEERYPAEMLGATEVRVAGGAMSLIYSTKSSGIVQITEGLTDIAEGSVSAATVGSTGYGYLRPPKITAAGGYGAEFDCGLNADGQITGIVCRQSGTGYSGGALSIGPPPEGGLQATGSYAVQSGASFPIPYSFRSGAFEYVTDSQDKRGGEVQTRHCSVVYQPTASESVLQLGTFYNNANYPRSNVARRDRGAGFIQSEVIPASILNMQATPQQEAESHGVARALFAGRVLDDFSGSDRHVSIELSGRQTAAGSVSIHQVDVFGVNEKQGK